MGRREGDGVVVRSRWQRGQLACAVAPLAVAYALMVLAQTKGPQIVGVLNGAAAQAEATKPPEDVAPGTPLLEYARTDIAAPILLLGQCS